MEEIVCRPQQVTDNKHVNLWTSHIHSLRNTALYGDVDVDHRVFCIGACRTIDDMYTLSEMEQNLWQARNVVQLLDESTADFRQVSCCSVLVAEPSKLLFLKPATW